MRYSDRACDLEPGADIGDVANRAINSGAVELNRSGLEHATSKHGTSIIHATVIGNRF